jgi:hypothetical protein
MINESDKLIKILNVDRVVPCRLCKRDTPYIRMGLCSNCWEMEKGIAMFIKIDKKKAKEWLLEQLKSLE